MLPGDLINIYINTCEIPYNGLVCLDSISGSFDPKN
jgi:hypothetical protein